MDRAEMIFRKSLESDNPNLKPNNICVNIILDGWAKMFMKRKKKTGKAAVRAEALLMGLWDRYDKKLDKHPIRPDRIAYTCCISAWGHSRSHECGERAQRLLDDMIDREARASEHGLNWSNLRPDAVVYNTVRLHNGFVPR